MEAELGQNTVEFSALVRRATEESFLSLKDLVDRSKSMDRPDSDKKVELLKFILKTRQRMLRLHVLSKWCHQVPLVHYCQQLLSTLSSHDTCFTQAADSLFFAHEGLQQAQAPIYDVPSSIEILLTGTYQRLPKCTQDLGFNTKLPEKLEKVTVRKLDTILRSKLLEIAIPEEISRVKVSNGTVLLEVDGEFRVLLTLGYHGHLSSWRILHLELLVGEKSGCVQLEDTRRYVLSDDLERRMSGSENPFTILYSILHELSIALVMDTLIRQVKMLWLGRWKDAIFFELISIGGNSGNTQYSQDGGEPDYSNLKLPGLKISYWLGSNINTGGSDYSLCPYIKIEPGSDLQIKCVHSTFILDPFSDKEAEFSLNKNCISLEKLLLKAIACNIHTRMLEIHMTLCKNDQFFQNSKDVIFQRQMEGTELDHKKELNDCKLDVTESFSNEILQVRAYGSMYITLGLSLRTGRFILQCSKNIIEQSVLSDFEDALNQESMTALEVFISLRTKSVLHLFASTGRFLGLEVYEQGLAILEIPKFMLNGLDMLLMGFPQCGALYYLMIQIDTGGDFKPLFKLLETQPNTGGGSSSVGKAGHIGLLKCFDIADLELVDDDLNLSLVNMDNLTFDLPNSIESSSCGLHQSFLKPQSSFSCMVDEMFKFEKGKMPDSMNGLVSEQKDNSHKRFFSDIFPPNLFSQESTDRLSKRRKISSHEYLAVSQAFTSPETDMVYRHAYERLRADANHGLAPNIYLTHLLHVVRNCSICIKHAQLTSQMDALQIPFVEDIGARMTEFSKLSFRLPFLRDNPWPKLCLCFGRSGTMSWDVKVNDTYFKELWELQKGSITTSWGSGIRNANTFDIDSHICCDSNGIVLSYKTVGSDSIQNLVSDLQRLYNARLFACGMRKLLMVKPCMTFQDSTSNSVSKIKGSEDSTDKMLEQSRKHFKIEAVGLMSLWFCYGLMPITIHFVVEWESGKEGCTMHLSPDQLWPHTKFLEDFINGGEVASFLDCVQLTAGPLHSLGSAIRPARVPHGTSILSPAIKHNVLMHGQGILPSASSSSAFQTASSGSVVSSVVPLGNHNIHPGSMLSSVNRGGPGIIPSSLLPSDVSVVLRGPYWIRIIYRKQFSIDMRCYAGDQVWLQPATPPKGGPISGGSLPCPQFRPFIMENIAQGLNALETGFAGNTNSTSSVAHMVSSGNRSNFGISRPTSLAGSQGAGGLSRIGNSLTACSGLSAIISGFPSRLSPTTSAPVHGKADLNISFIGLGDDGGYGGGWVPIAALKKVLRGILKYLGVLWLFAQLPGLLKAILGSILNENEGGILNLDQEQPALRFFVGGYVYAVSVHRVQLLLQVLSVKRFHHHQQQQQTQSNTQEELASAEINEICDYFSRRVASEPYDASRVASFITLATLPISVLREFLKLTSWEKKNNQGATRVELCLENHVRSSHLVAAKSNIHHNRDYSTVEFSLTFVLDSSLVPQVNAAGGAAWLAHCVSVRLKYSFGESACGITLISIDGSHGGKACWCRPEDWEKIKHRLSRTVNDFGSGNAMATEISQGNRLRLISELLRKTLQACLQQNFKDSSASASSLSNTSGS